jgi:hypothetical protein
MFAGHLAYRRPKRARIVGSGVVAKALHERDGNAPVLAHGRIHEAALQTHPPTERAD